jgi:hypothetical protein
MTTNKTVNVIDNTSTAGYKIDPKNVEYNLAEINNTSLSKEQEEYAASFFSKPTSSVEKNKEFPELKKIYYTFAEGSLTKHVGYVDLRAIADKNGKAYNPALVSELIKLMYDNSSYYQTTYKNLDSFATFVNKMAAETFRVFVTSYLKTRGIDMSTSDGKNSYLYWGNVELLDKKFGNVILK